MKLRNTRHLLPQTSYLIILNSVLLWLQRLQHMRNLKFVWL